MHSSCQSPMVSFLQHHYGNSPAGGEGMGQQDFGIKTYKKAFLLIMFHAELVKNLVNNGINYQPQLVIAGFLNHQQYVHMA